MFSSSHIIPLIALSITYCSFIDVFVATNPESAVFDAYAWYLYISPALSDVVLIWYFKLCCSILSSLSIQSTKILAPVISWLLVTGCHIAVFEKFAFVLSTYISWLYCNSPSSINSSNVFVDIYTLCPDAISPIVIL